VPEQVRVRSGRGLNANARHGWLTASPNWGADRLAATKVVISDWREDPTRIFRARDPATRSSSRNRSPGLDATPNRISSTRRVRTCLCDSDRPPSATTEREPGDRCVAEALARREPA
jgi:hypothetical protein